MDKAKIISFVTIFVLLSSVTQAQGSEGFFQRAYRKYILKEKTTEKKPSSKPENTDTVREVSGEDVKTTVYGGVYKDMSRAEMIQEIKDEVNSEEDILEQIPELKRQKGEDGQDVYSYLVEGKQVNLEDVDEKILRDLIEQVEVKASQLRINAIREQQEQLRVIRNINAVQPPPQTPQRPPDIPRRPPTTPRR